jgi:gamma-glutamylcyclotransferase (GGCT)/AIG2-like uncharacterized protein YtfP
VTGSRFFFYGTLMDPVILRTVLRREVNRRLLRRAVLPGFRRVFHSGASYPVLVADSGSEVDGIVAAGLTRRDAALLARYEGAEYRVAKHQVRIGASTALAAVFLPRQATVATTTKWTYGEWCRRFRARFLRQVGHRHMAPVADRRCYGATGLQRR